ncbi:MAG TPA: hypothetical protein VME68_09995 [Acidobacteriaceae bacterium]|nr:hypothetical protein [Acidobacteriaceae bacterium]
MLVRHIARILPFLAAPLLSAACAAQVMGAPGTLPNGRRFPIVPGQQIPPATTLQPQTSPQAPVAQPGQPAAAPVAPATLATPPSLLDKPAQPAIIQFAGKRLTVTADNSSLTDILHQLSSSSGMTIDGLDKDSRVFGTYGPGDPREILSELLDGAGYNVMMVGGTAAGTPRQLLLSARSNAPITQGASAPPESDDDQEDTVMPLNNYPGAGEIQPRPPMPPQPQQNPNGGVRTPQQMLQEMMQQRQQMQQQQQQQQQNPQ